MRSSLKKILAVALMAAMIACVGAGCGNKDNKTQESSTTSAQSTASTNESKTESNDESKTESKDESKTESTVESKTENSEESTEQPSETEAPAEAEVLGTYIFGAGADATASITLGENGAADINNGESTKEGTWSMEGTVLTLVLDDDTQLFTYETGKLTSQANAAYVFVKQAADAPTVEDIAGYYIFGAGANILATLQLNADGTLTLTNSENNTMEGTWTVEGSKVTIVTDDTQVFEYSNNTLYSAEAGAGFTKATPPAETVSEADVIGTYGLGAGEGVIATITLSENGVAVINNGEAEKEGTWTLEGKNVSIVTDDTEVFTFENGKLASQSNPAYVFTMMETEE